MVTVISRFRVRNGFEDQVRAAFLARPRLVENETGFCGLEVLTDASDGSVFLLITRWTSEAAFRSWHSSTAHHASHELIPQGLKLDASFTQIVIGNRIEDLHGAITINDAIEGQTVALSRWVLDSDTVFAMILNPDGTIRLRNRAAKRMFPAHPDSSIDVKIWEFLVCSEAESLARRLSDPEARNEDSFRLNVSAGESNPITVEVSLLDCAGGFLMLGAVEEAHALRLQAERQILTNQLATMARELARKNKDLEAANRSIEHMARTDALTGLSNRRTLDELLAHELARANRQHQPLTLILADIDYFKRINDIHGHVMGDQVLSALGRVFGNQVRTYDIAARYGGEEFALLFPATGCPEGIAIAERLRKQVSAIQVPGGPERITVSFGVATLTENETAEAFIARTDAALYRAKNGGRNRVEADEVCSFQP
jgi:diguanylate cyclase (GGDEF)-like protein